jgi:hypothetical protein
MTKEPFMRSSSIALSCLIAAASLSACGVMEHPAHEGAGGDDDTASIVLALTMVPSDVQCLEVAVTGAGTITQLFSLTPGAAASVVVPGLPSGAVSITERAFAVACSQVTAMTPATWVSTMPATATLAPGQTADVNIVLRRPGQVRIANDFQDGQFLTAQGALPFPNTVLGTTATSTFMITNGGTTTATLPALSIAGTDASQFTVQTPSGAGNPCSATTSLAPGMACMAGVRFAPTSTGAKAATFMIGSVAAMSLSGTGVSAGSALSPSPTSLAFGTVSVGNGSSMSFTITNPTTVAATLPTLQASGADAAQFTVQAPAGVGAPCLVGNSLAAGASCTSGVRFAPTSAGAKVASLLVGSTWVSLSGTGVTATSISPSATALAFGTTNVGSTRSMSFSITNTGTTAVTLQTLLPGGADAAQFTVQAPAGAGAPCLVGNSLAAGASCTSGVRFAPTSTGQKVASLLVGSTWVSLSGTGI